MLNIISALADNIKVIMSGFNMVPPVTHRKWEDIVTGRIKCNFKFLAAKILMGRILVSLQEDPSPKNIDKCIYEIYMLFFKNEKVAHDDLVEIFGQELK